jgi:hypothetical protein
VSGKKVTWTAGGVMISELQRIWKIRAIDKFELLSPNLLEGPIFDPETTRVLSSQKIMT